MSAALADGLRTRQSAGRVVMDMQRAIEGAAGRRFALTASLPADWADRLAEAGRASIRTPGMARRWAEAVKAAREYVDGLREGGTRRQAEHALARIQKALTQGSTELLDQRMRWWLYDRQIYNLKRIVRTEMATAHHRAVIATTEGDADVVGYRWRLSASHPEPDICDYYADVDHGMGAGVWPKDRVPRSKAHPHCMCLLIPTTRRMRQDGKRGLTDVAQFMERLPEATRERLVPRWAQDLRALGVPFERLQRPDGNWLISQEEARALMGGERFAAQQAIGRALRERQWGAPRIKRGSRLGRETLALVEAHQDDPAARRVAAALREPGRVRVAGGDVHYLRRRYADGLPIRSLDDLDRRVEALGQDPATEVREQRIGDLRRYALYSTVTRETAIIDAAGRRVTTFPLDGSVRPESLGGLLWTIADLAR